MVSVYNIVIMVAVGVCLVSQSYARPQYSSGSGSGSGDGSATILRDDRDMDGKGQYTFAFETSNGIFRQEQGSENNGMEQTGGWTYTSPEGVPVEITFVANGGGFQPVGALLPVAPPLPYQRTQVYHK